MRMQMNAPVACLTSKMDPNCACILEGGRGKAIIFADEANCVEKDFSAASTGVFSAC